MSGDEPKPPPKSGEGTSPTAEGDTKSAEAKAPSDKPRAANQHQAQKQTLMINASPEELRMRIEEAKSVSRAPGAKPADAKPTDATPNDGVTGKAQTSDTKPTEAKTPEAAPKTKPTPSPVPPVTASEGAISVRYFGATDVGLVREHNEDNFIVADLAARVRGIEADTPREVSVEGLGVLLAVCDGMGGAAAGEVASQMAVDTVYDVLTSWEPTKDRDVFARRLVRAVEEAGTRIYSAAKMDRTRRGMGTTSTVAGLMDKVLFVGQVGDSRAYLRRGDSVVLITKDQSLVNQLIEAGQLTEEEAEAFEHSNIILQALGTTEDVQVDLTFIELRQGDRLMLCSDGLSGLVHPELIADVLKGTPDLVQCAKKLIDMANAGGGHDNITVICADFTGDGLSAADADTPAMYQQYPLPAAIDDETMPPRGAKSNVTASKLAEETPAVGVPAMSAVEARVRLGTSSLVRWWVLLLVALSAVVLLFGSFLLFAKQTQEDNFIYRKLRGLLQPNLPTVEVAVESDVEGDLYVDGRREGHLGGERITVQLPVGEYVFEARSGGMVVASTTQSVSSNAENVVSLAPPGMQASLDGAVSIDAGQAPSPPDPGAAAPSPPTEPTRASPSPPVRPAAGSAGPTGSTGPNGAATGGTGGSAGGATTPASGTTAPKAPATTAPKPQTPANPASSEGSGSAPSGSPVRAPSPTTPGPT